MRCRVALAALALIAMMALTTTPVVDAAPMWGASGHYITAAIAQGLLTPAARQGCSKLLPWVQGRIDQIASWADSSARFKYPWSAQLHYADTPDWLCNYQQPRDCIGGKDGKPMACVDGAIQNYTRQIGDTRLTDTARADALMFLVHFVGDIHQPLHVGFTSDQGGNTLVGSFCGHKSRKLHQVWDGDIIDKRIKEDFGGSNTTYLQYYMKELAKGGKFYPSIPQWSAPCYSKVSEPHGACSVEWAQEGIKLACSTAYTDERGQRITNGFDLGESYYRFAMPAIESQLARGGIRLATVLNSIFAGAHAEQAGLEQTEPQQDARRRKRGVDYLATE